MRYRVALSAAVILSLSLTSCSINSSPSSIPSDIGELKIINGSAVISVPALWAGTNSDGVSVGGIEPAQIVVSTAGKTPEYRVDLADIEAEGAGDAWQAATSMAAAFATVFVGADPASVDLNFTITGPIDGPSAGGILTVGLIAAFRGESISPGHTMTGAITADGSIGVVGGVPTKLEAAAQAGFTTVVLPASLNDGDWTEGSALVTLADSLGIEVVPVNTIGEAYSAMTGTPIETPELAFTTAFQPAMQGVIQETTSSNIDDLRSMLDKSAQVIDPELLSWAEDKYREAARAQNAGNFAAANGETVLTLTEVSRAIAREETVANIGTEGIVETRRQLLADAQQLLEFSSIQLDKSSQLPVVGLSQCFALPTAMGWASFTQVTMDGIITKLPEAEEVAVLAEISESIAEGRLGVEMFLPQALDAVTSLSVGAGEDCAEVAGHLSSYSRFLVQAAQSSENYLRDVLGLSLDDSSTGLSSDYVAGALSAKEFSSRLTQNVEDYSTEAEQLTTAVTYFWLTSYAVSATQAYVVIPNLETGDFDALSQSSMNTAIDQTWWFIDLRSKILESQGLDLGSVNWSARWALEASLGNRDGEFATQSGWLAQGELWFDAIQIMTTLSYLEPTTISSASSPES